MLRRTLLPVVAALALAAGPVLAQRPGGGGMGYGPVYGMGGMGMMGGSMGAAMWGAGMTQSVGPQPVALLAAADALKLTEAQRARLEKVQQTAWAELQDHARAAWSAREKAARALSDTSPDLGAYEKALREAADQGVATQVAFARSARDGLAVLTPEQRQQVEASTTAGWWGMMNGMYGPGMYGPGMHGPGGMGGYGGMMGPWMWGGGAGGPGACAPAAGGGRGMMHGGGR